jgi:hypothetical protein
MSRPGVEVSSATAPQPANVPTDTSVLFIVGEAQMGPLDAPTLLTSLDRFTEVYGQRMPGTFSYDSLDAAFHEGVSTAYFMRMNDGGAAATGDLSVITGGATTCVATNPGVWGNSMTIEVVAAPTTLSAMSAQVQGDDDGDDFGAPPPPEEEPQQRSTLLTYDDAPAVQAAGEVIATVKINGAAVQTSSTLATNQDLADFLATGPYVAVTSIANATAAPLPGVGTFTGGTDGTVPVDEPGVLPDALALIPPELGPGQILAPGRSDFTSHAALLSHAAGTSTVGVNRVAFLDGNPNDDDIALEAAASLLRGAAEDRYGSLWAPWAVIPGLAPGTTRLCPWSAIQAGICARNDASGVVNQAGAGQWGVSNYAMDLWTTFTKQQMEDLLFAGVNTARTVYGVIEAYAFRTLADPSGPRADWVQLNHARLNMSIVAQSEAVGEGYVFGQIDGRQHLLAAFGGGLAGFLTEMYNEDELFGTDVTDAFNVNTTGLSVNPPAQLADGVIKAVIQVRMSPHAELVQIEIVKVPITQSLVA